MAITSYTELKSAIDNWTQRSDVASRADEFIALCEADLQVKCKLLEAETAGTVTITNGSGALPTGYVAMRSVYWDGSPDRELRYVTPEVYDALRANDSGDGYYYTITGSTIRTSPMGSGSVVCTYMARFTGLSGSNASNAILASFPNAYLFGCLFQAAIFARDEEEMKKYGLLFNAVCDRINQNDEDRRHGGSTLQVRAR